MYINYIRNSTIWDSPRLSRFETVNIVINFTIRNSSTNKNKELNKLDVNTQFTGIRKYK